MGFAGYVQIESTLNAPMLFRDSSRAPVNLDALPTVRVYGDQGLLPLATVTGSLMDSGAVAGATNASPIVIHSVAHGLTSGTYVTITGVGGNTAANGNWVVTRVDADNFSLNGSTGNGSWTSGGTWNVAGLYSAPIVCSAANGFVVGEAYTALFQGAIAGQPTADTLTFIVT